MATRGVRGIRGARKMPSLRKPVVHALRTPGEWNALLESTPGLLLVEFTAPWSAPCKAMAPYLPLLAAQPEYAAVVFARVDVDASPELGARLGVQHAPTYHFYRDGTRAAAAAGRRRARGRRRRRAIRACGGRGGRTAAAAAADAAAPRPRPLSPP